MIAFWNEWRALTRSYAVLSGVLLLVPLGIIFGRSVAMVAVFTFAAVALYQLAARALTWAQLDPLAKYALLLVGVLLCVATPFAAYDVLRSLRISLLWACFPLFYITVTAVCTRHKAVFYPALAVTWGLLFAMMLDGAVQRLTGESVSGTRLIDTSDRLTGLMSNVNFTAVVTTFLFVALAWCVGRLRTRGIVGVLALVLVATAIGMVSGERSATLLLFASLGLGGLILVWRYPPMRLPVLGVALTLAATVLLAWNHMPYLQERVAHFQGQMIDFPYSLYGQLYQTAIILWLKSPLTGIGVSNFRLGCPQVAAYYYLECNLHPHNYVLEFLTEGGALACILWGLVITAFGRLCVAAYRAGGAVQRVAVVGVMIGVFHLWPIIGNQSAFSTWRASLLWYALAMWTAAYRLSLDAKE